MTTKTNLKPVAAVIGAAFVGSLSVVTLANAADNPFGVSQLQSGYMLLADNHEAAKEMEGKCGGDKDTMEGKCGEGKCGGDKGKMEGKCGDGKEMKEGKCGEGKCGGDNKS